ncbi:MAG: anti-sigma factor domain-containing protein [Rubrobacteraceae bacterium]
MECNERIKDLLPDYHLGQLSPEESEEVRLHLAEHESCRKEFEEVAEVLDLVPFAYQTAEPPPGLKERVMAEVLSEPEAPEASSPALDRPEPVSVRERPASTRRGLVPLALPLAAAAAVLIAFVGLLWAYVDLRQDNQQLRAEVQELQDSVRSQGELLAVAAEGTGRAPEARGTAVVDPGTGALALDVYNLPAAPTDHAYHAWLVSSTGDAVSLGLMEIGDQGYGQMTGGVSEPLEQFDSVQLTIEPIGAESMSGPVYLEASL